MFRRLQPLVSPQGEVPSPAGCQAGMPAGGRHSKNRVMDIPRTWNYPCIRALRLTRKMRCARFSINARNRGDKHGPMIEAPRDRFHHLPFNFRGDDLRGHTHSQGKDSIHTVRKLLLLNTERALGGCIRSHGGLSVVVRSPRKRRRAPNTRTEHPHQRAPEFVTLLAFLPGIPVSLVLLKFFWMDDGTHCAQDLTPLALICKGRFSDIGEDVTRIFLLATGED